MFYFFTCFLMIALAPFDSGSEPATTSGIITGTVTDANTGEPIPYVYLHLEEINRTSTTDRSGYFRFTNVPDGTYTLVAHRIGYINQTRRVQPSGPEEAPITIELTPAVITGTTVEVIGQADQLRGANLEHASSKILGTELRRNLGTTLAETLQNQPGMETRSMGVAPGRPVIRGLGDYRVLILQDGERPGDVSALSADHSVSIDPASANEIQIARGPAALVYGSNAIGGVINVVKDHIPTSVPSAVTGTATLQGNSVNNGATAAGLLTLPYKDFAINLDLNGRTGSDFNTPEGRVENSFIQTGNATAGISYIRPWGYTGLSGAVYRSSYGIPPDPNGGHPAGVDIDMKKYQLDGKTELVFTNHFFKLAELSASLKHYNHIEYETDEIIGTEFGLFSTTATLKARHKGVGFLDDGIVGIWGEFQDFAVRGSRSPDSNSWNGSVFTVQEADFGPLHLEFGLRFDHNITRPKEDAPGSRIGHIRQRTFSALSSSASAIYDIGAGFYAGGILMHSYRSPALEELYSEGPHLAAYSFEIGNPDLEPERGLGKEIFIRYKTNSVVINTALYHNGFSNYLYARDTGRPNNRFPSLNDYQFTGVKAEIYGAEASAELQVSPSLIVESRFSYTIGNRTIDDDEREVRGIEASEAPLPMMPPVKAAIGMRYAFHALTFGADLQYSGKQNRLSDFETTTEASAIVNASAQYRFDSGGLFHTLALRGQNLLNQTYRSHLSRIKDIFPEPGRNISLLYRVYF